MHCPPDRAIATTDCISGDDVKDLILPAIGARFGHVKNLPQTIRWLTDNVSGILPARADAWHATTVIDTLPIWFDPYDTVRPRKAHGNLSPRVPIASRQSV